MQHNENVHIAWVGWIHGPVLLAGIAYLDLEQEKHYVERTY